MPSLTEKITTIFGRSTTPENAALRMKWWMTNFLRKNYNSQPIDESKYEFGDWEGATECLYLGPQTSIILNGYATPIYHGAVINHPEVLDMIRRTGLDAKPLKNHLTKTVAGDAPASTLEVKYDESVLSTQTAQKRRGRPPKSVQVSA